MGRSVTRRDLFWGYAASALNVGAGLILLPIVLRHLSPDDVGLWFVFLTLASLAQLLEMGFQPTLARNVAYIYAGATSLVKVGLPDAARGSAGLDQALLDALVASARRIYQAVAALAALVLLGPGTFYIRSLLTPHQDHTRDLIGWVVFASGFIINFYYGYVNGLLQGRGDVTQANKVIVVTRAVMILLGGAAVAAGYGMLGLGAASALSAISGRGLAYRYFHASHPVRGGKGQGAARLDLIRTLWYNASRLGLVQLGAFLIQRGSILVASSFLGLAVAGQYGMTVTVLMTLSGVASVICQVQVPHMSALQAKADKAGLSAVFGEIVLLAWTVYLLGFVVLATMGGDMLGWIGSRTRLIPQGPLIALGLVILLEMNHALAATYVTTANKVPFLRAALISGVCTLLLSLAVVRDFGITGLIVAQGGVQLAYNNWKWPRMARRDLGASWSGLIRAGLRRALRAQGGFPAT